MENETVLPDNFNTSLSTAEEISQSLRTADATILAVASIVGLLGNSLVFISFCLSRKIRSKTNIFVVNLSVADFLTCCFLPVIAWSLLVETDQIDSKMDTMCGFTTAAVQQLSGCSVLTLTAIAINRYILITKTLPTYKMVYDHKYMLIWLTVTWLFPFLPGIVPLLFGVGHLGFDKDLHACGAKTDNANSHLYDFIFVGILIPGPMLVTIFCYVRIYLYIANHNKHLKQNPAGTRKLRTFNSFRSLFKKCTKSHQPQISEPELDITQNLFLVVIAFIVFLSPQLVAEILDASPVVILHTSILVTVNSCVNPILYGFKHPVFKEVFKCIILCRWKAIPQPAFKWMRPLNSKSG
ncbi:Melatonin receptor type 1C [Holothuria leucospilota]|uniref:Melatonin receptor type 1C n=1 Tax=Holothuria leucospilota TaxID=206669 RepID=A0A9Q1BFE9_HOLLE|nr:Melatonin receptor type 1C [Holothuria leucospilota]